MKTFHSWIFEFNSWITNHEYVIWTLLDTQDNLTPRHTYICRSHPATNGQLHDQFQQKEQALGAPECNFVNSEYVFSHKLWSLCPLFFIFSSNNIASKTMKNAFYFILKALFCSRDIQIFAFLSSTLFLFVSHCFRGWLKINLKVYDVSVFQIRT